MPMVIPVHRRLLDRFDYLCPGLKTAFFEGKGAQRFPPRLTEVEIGRILRLKHKLPTRVGQTKQQDIGRPMDIQIIHNRIEAFVLRRHPLLHVAEEIHPVGDRASEIISGQRLPGRWTKRAKDVPLAPTAIINFLRSALPWTPESQGRCRGHQLLPCITLRRHWSHLIETDYRTLFRWLGVERFNGPLFLANSGSTRSPNHVSWVRQRSPSASNNSSIRLRLIGIFFSSLRYVASRSSVQHANGWLSCCGFVNAVAMTSETCSGGYVTGRPERG